MRIAQPWAAIAKNASASCDPHQVGNDTHVPDQAEARQLGQESWNVPFPVSL